MFDMYMFFSNQALASHLLVLVVFSTQVSTRKLCHFFILQIFHPAFEF